MELVEFILMFLEDSKIHLRQRGYSFRFWVINIFQGLCGTFSGNQYDDFLTPQNDVEENPTEFANQ